MLQNLLRHRDVSKLKSFVDILALATGDDGRIHTTFNQTIAATGRLSSTDPNLQNIPIRTEEGRRIRKGFVVGPGYETLLTADYSQIELRIMADLSGDEALTAAFMSGHDFHAATASRVFGVDPHDVSPEIAAPRRPLAHARPAAGLLAPRRRRPLGGRPAPRPAGARIPVRPRRARAVRSADQELDQRPAGQPADRGIRTAGRVA